MKKSRILVLEEHPPAVKVLRESLGNAHDLTFARHEREAFDALAQGPFDLIISKVFFEREDAFHFLYEIRSDERYKHLPFVCVSALQTPRARQLNDALSKSFKRLGADGYLKIDDYCVDDECDFSRLRTDIERFLHNSHVA